MIIVGAGLNHWFHLAGMYNGLPLEDRTAVEVLADPTRPQITPARDRYVYFPDAAEVPEAAAVNIRNRSYSIAVEVDIDSPDDFALCGTTTEGVCRRLAEHPGRHRNESGRTWPNDGPPA